MRALFAFCLSLRSRAAKTRRVRKPPVFIRFDVHASRPELTKGCGPLTTPRGFSVAEEAAWRRFFFSCQVSKGYSLLAFTFGKGHYEEYHIAGDDATTPFAPGPWRRRRCRSYVQGSAEYKPVTVTAESELPSPVGSADGGGSRQKHGTPAYDAHAEEFMMPSLWATADR